MWAGLNVFRKDYLMDKTDTVRVLRRDFLASSSLLLFGVGSLKAAISASQAAPRGSDLSESLSPEELAIANGSIMAKDIDNFWHKGYSCAETGLMVALRFMKKPEELVWVAGGFGGGVGHQDLCGFLTAGVMAIGLYTGSLGIDKKAAKERCGRMTNQYWNWWASTAPLRCRDIREGHKDFNVCHRLGKLAAVRLEDLMKA
jgi:hypothetical protein